MSSKPSKNGVQILVMYKKDHRKPLLRKLKKPSHPKPRRRRINLGCSALIAYANERTLKTHLNSVALKDIARKAPDVSGLLEHMNDLSVSALLDIAKKKTVGDLAAECSTYANRLAVFIRQCNASKLMEYLAQVLTESFKVRDVVFLSVLRETVTSATNKLLNTQTFRVKVKELCNEFIACSNSLLNYFIGNFIMELSNKVLVFVCRVMQDKAAAVASGPKKRSKDDFSSLRFKRIVHYISGSIVCGMNRRRKNYPTSTHIKTFASVMNKTFVEDKEDESTWCDKEIREWTETQNRGGLCFVSKAAFNFFIELFTVVMCHEEEDGSVLLETVNESVSRHFQLLNMWDMLVSSSLSEEHSVEWLTAVVDIVCRCVSKGIIKRRLNDALKKPTSNVAHRPKLAR